MRAVDRSAARIYLNQTATKSPVAAHSQQTPHLSTTAPHSPTTDSHHATAAAQQNTVLNMLYAWNLSYLCHCYEN